MFTLCSLGQRVSAVLAVCLSVYILLGCLVISLFCGGSGLCVGSLFMSAVFGGWGGGGVMAGGFSRGGQRIC
jgi:hypothetical protein